ncbi:DUF6933 domain-containing protein [Pseudomonas fluorescens]|uniref:DUF6933 domain-containing protein n=1 Tax=Pseudomonas fluorescens TaxID=294 RepID=A0A5E7FIL4_PSEFL|nr:hypothetical protein [Pseudomonas fluorescens]VVO38764.1 hypothetical protein PS723_05622 [Pseudomonas fluorescens]
MLVFNCTEAASGFFSRVHKGKTITPVQRPPSTPIDDDQADDSTSAPSQWLVHAITVQRKHVLLAIHLQTRYCMIFADMKKADVDGFVQAFAQRWMNNMLNHALHRGVLEWVEYPSMLERFTELNREFSFYRRSDRSAQGHLNEIVWMFKGDVADAGCLPPDEAAASRYDTRTNHCLRSRRLKDYFYPDEEMLIHWLQKFCGVSEVSAQEAGELSRQLNRERSDQEWAPSQS